MDDNNNDIDICVSNGIIPYQLFDWFDSYQLKDQYDIPFNWGGTTYQRIKGVKDNQKYDVFFVDDDTFDAINHATGLLIQLPLWMHEYLKNDKDLRVHIFQVFAREYIKNIQPF